MTVTIRQVGPGFAGEVDGIDMRRPLTSDGVAAIDAGMDKYAALVFHDQKISDEQQLAFTRSPGEIEHAIGTACAPPTRPGSSRRASRATCDGRRWPATAPRQHR